MKVEGECGRKSQVDRNQRATTNEAGEGGNAVCALAVAQRICHSVQADAALRASRLLKELFHARSKFLQRRACKPQSIASSDRGQSGDGNRKSEITASSPKTNKRPPRL
eukprot:6193855-Pleurochrysis_carterae.AAC.1